MKKLIALSLLCGALNSIEAQTGVFVPYRKPLPTIDKDGTVHTSDSKIIKIDDFNDTTTTVFFLVRHAEKDTTGGTNADLNAVGRGRAEAFPKILKKVKIAGIYSTDKPRTRNTALPLAKAKRQTVAIYDAKKQEELVRDLVNRGGGKRYFIVGHSNTIPQLAFKILRGDEKPTADLPDTEYSQLYIVSVKKIGVAKVEVISF